MEPVTHFLTGACLARSGFNRLTGLATLTMTLAAEAPDLDILYGFKGPVVGFHHHRGFTHTLLGAPVVAAVVVAVLWLLHRVSRRLRPSILVPVRWGVLYLLAVLAALSHILLDFTNNYGVRPFAPFNTHWYALDIIYILEPVLLILLLLGLLLPELFGLVASEVGARGPRFRGRIGAIVALLGMVTYWMICAIQHRTAIQMLESREMQTGRARQIAAMPYPSNPFRWFGVGETERAYETYDIRTQRLELLPYGNAGTYFKPPETQAILAAKQSLLGQTYLDWSRFPVVEAIQDNEWTVYFRDVRFMYSPLASRTQSTQAPPLSARVILDRELHVQEQWMGRKQQK